MKSYMCKGRRVLFTDEYVLIDVYRKVPEGECKELSETFLESDEVKVLLTKRKGYLIKVLATPKGCEEIYALLKRSDEPTAELARELLKKAYEELYGIEIGEVECVEES